MRRSDPETQPLFLSAFISANDLTPHFLYWLFAFCMSIFCFSLLAIVFSRLYSTFLSAKYEYKLILRFIFRLSLIVFLVLSQFLRPEKVFHSFYKGLTY